MVGGLGSLDEATTVACPEAVTLLGSMDEPAGSRLSEVEEVEVEDDVCGGGPIEEEVEVDDAVLVVLMVAVGAVAVAVAVADIDILACAELVVAAAEVAGTGLLEDGNICAEGEEQGILGA